LKNLKQKLKLFLMV